jgi:hypothetical protein
MESSNIAVTARRFIWPCAYGIYMRYGDRLLLFAVAFGTSVLRNFLLSLSRKAEHRNRGAGAIFQQKVNSQHLAPDQSTVNRTDFQ